MNRIGSSHLVLVALALGLAACSSPAFDLVGPPTAAGSSESGVESSSEDDTSGAPTGGDDPGAETGGDDDGSGGTTGASKPPYEPGEFAGCPDPLPDGWVLCEDFERIDNLATTFFEYQDGEGAFVLSEGGAASGTHAMTATYREGLEGAGYLSAAFGRNPIVYGELPQASTDTDFQSIYWRLRVKMHEGWPDVGPGHLTSATAFASDAWDQAMIARLRSDADNVVLWAEPISCVVGDSVACNGFEDTDGQRALGGLVGATPLFSSKQSGKWHCVEAHVALNTPGASDGAFEFWVDGELQNAAYQLDWRGTWAEYGINLVTVQNLWPGGAPAELERSIDDLVISTAPIGCD
ncbi:MAG: hypothetical protein IPH07_28660 [Deltaproteobacteria bacterium]|nr:hypothetical protein [Deltaproteobacteria bacterium]MBK8714877.1 hypothetical protein [Deltaproteobacteria bacterium]MBP7287408.1 hypothetical protein [Nannocystaceae bacterium]